MAARKKSTPKNQQDAQEAKAARPEEEQPQTNGVAVIAADDGQLQVQTLGETRATEAPTLLRIAANNVEKGLIEQS